MSINYIYIHAICFSKSVFSDSNFQFWLINLTCAFKESRRKNNFMVLSCFVFPSDDRDVQWHDIFKSLSNRELLFAGPHPAAVGCYGYILKNTVKCISEELLRNDTQMVYPYFAFNLELLISNKDIWKMINTHLDDKLAVIISQQVLLLHFRFKNSLLPSLS